MNEEKNIGISSIFTKLGMFPLTFIKICIILHYFESVLHIMFLK